MRARLITAWLIFPPLVAFLLPLFSLVPNWLENQPLGAEHCWSHRNGIAHLCWFEPLSETPFIQAGMVLFMPALGLGVSKAAAALMKYRCLQQWLQAISTPDPRRGCFYVASNYPVAFCAGLLRPRVFISRCLLRELSEKQLAVILAHEQNHCRRRDNLRRVLIRGFSLFHWPNVRRALLGDLELAQEQICDEAAAATVGDRLSVAETIVVMERRVRASFLPEMTGAMAFNGSHTEARVQALLKAPRPVSSLGLMGTVLISVLLTLGLFTLSMPLHHLPALF